MKKFGFAGATAAALAVVLMVTGCSSASTSEEGATSTADLETIKVGASPTPHAEVLELIVDDMAELGYNLEIVTSDDLLQPDNMLAEGEIDCNYYQHVAGMEWYNENNNTNLVAVGGNEDGRIHYEPLGIYSNKITSLADLADGATVTVANETSNEARSLLLLQQEGLITLAEDAGTGATIQDIVDNPKNLNIQEIDGANLVRSLDDADIAIITGNYALDAGLKVATDALATESTESDAAYYYANILAVNSGDENKDSMKALLKCLQSDEVKEFMEKEWNGAVVPLF